MHCGERMYIYIYVVVDKTMHGGSHASDFICLNVSLVTDVNQLYKCCCAPIYIFRQNVFQVLCLIFSTYYNSM